MYRPPLRCTDCDGSGTVLVLRCQHSSPCSCSEVEERCPANCDEGLMRCSQCPDVAVDVADVDGETVPVCYGHMWAAKRKAPAAPSRRTGAAGEQAGASRRV